MPDESKADDKKKRFMPLKTVQNHRDVYEEVLNLQLNGEIDPKTADGVNTTLKGAVYLNIRLPFEVAKMWMNSKIRKIDFPENLLPK